MQEDGLEGSEMKTSELQGAALDYAVAKCEYPGAEHLITRQNPFQYSTDWSQGGPIIEREKIELHPAGDKWSSDIDHYFQHYGPTPLIAAMRCYVQSKLGDEFNIPEKLK